MLTMQWQGSFVAVVLAAGWAWAAVMRRSEHYRQMAQQLHCGSCKQQGHLPTEKVPLVSAHQEAHHDKMPGTYTLIVYLSLI